jgi:hypothetical protein
MGADGRRIDMEKLTEYVDGKYIRIKGTKSLYERYERDGAPLSNAIVRLAAYEETGLKPEAVEHLKLASMGKAIAEIKEFEGVPIDRLRKLAQAEKTGQLVVLSEPMKPMVYKPNDTDVYCPSCGESLSGGWPLSDADDLRKLCQCPNCGQSIDDTRCEAAEAALEAQRGENNA